MKTLREYINIVNENDTEWESQVRQKCEKLGLPESIVRPVEYYENIIWTATPEDTSDDPFDFELPQEKELSITYHGQGELVGTQTGSGLAGFAPEQMIKAAYTNVDELIDALRYLKTKSRDTNAFKNIGLARANDAEIVESYGDYELEDSEPSYWEAEDIWEPNDGNSVYVVWPSETLELDTDHGIIPTDEDLETDHGAVPVDSKVQNPGKLKDNIKKYGRKFQR